MTGPEARAFLEKYSLEKELDIGTEGMTDEACITMATLVKSVEELESQIKVVWG